MQKVLDNGEILGLILGHLSRQLCARLVTTSQNFFKQGAPHIWRNLHTPQPLFLLIPGVKKVTGERYHDIYLKFPSPADFSRFDYYARFVQRLDIFADAFTDGFFIDASWQTILLRAQQSTLLTNLRALKLNKSGKPSDDPALWLTAFLSPSVKTFEMKSVHSYADAASSVAAVALNLVAQRCPEVENVTFYLGPPEHTNSSGSNKPALASAINSLMGAPISRTWPSVRNLRSLVTDVYTLDASSFLALGELPCLSSLEIRKMTKSYYSNDLERLPASAQSVALSNSSFPSLRHLAFHKTHHDDILLLWNHKPLVEELNRVELTVPLAPDRFTANQLVRNEQFLTPFLPALCEGSTQLTTLVINNSSDTSELGALDLDIEHFKCLGQLPLQHVKIVDIHICYIDSDGNDHSVAQQAAILWPLAVELDLPNQKVDPNELHYFATIPNLRRLVLGLWDSWPDDVPSPPTFDNHPLCTLELSQESKDDLGDVPMDKFARYLLSFWPNLQQVGNPTGANTISIGILNQFIRMSQGMAKVKQRITRRYGAQEVQNLLPAELMDFVLH